MSKRPSQSEDDLSVLTVRVPRALVTDIDQERNSRLIKVPRNTWILEAVVEKLNRDRMSNRNGLALGIDHGQK